MEYLKTTHDVYKEAAITPDVGLCCTTTSLWKLPGLNYTNSDARNELRVWKHSKSKGFKWESKGALCWRWWWNGITTVCLFLA